MLFREVLPAPFTHGEAHSRLEQAFQVDGGAPAAEIGNRLNRLLRILEEFEDALHPNGDDFVDDAPSSGGLEAHFGGPFGQVEELDDIGGRQAVAGFASNVVKCRVN